MTAQRTLALISYNGSNNDPGNRDFALASQLANYLRQNGVDAETKNYSATSLKTNNYQWLILIPSREIIEPAHLMNKVVDDALNSAVKRQMKGVLAVTTGFDLPTKWITIRKYDASDPKEVDHALQGVLRAMQYAKVPYTEAKALVQTQQAHQAAAAQQQKAAQKRRKLLFASGAAVLLLIIATLFGVNYYPTIFHSTPSALSLTATAQAHRSATNTAIGKTQTPSSSPIVDPTAQAMQHQYDSITGKTPTITGFQQSEQWSVTLTDTTACKFDVSHPSNYHATIQTSGEYIRCMETKTEFKDFALQVTMNINGDAGGIIFRDNGQGDYYRLAFNQSDGTYSVFLCSSGVCDTSTSNPNVGTVNNGSLITSKTVQQNGPITFTIIVKGNNIGLYLNKTFLANISAIPADATSNTSTNTPLPLSGFIGVFAADAGTITDVTFSSLKVWSLDTSPTKNKT